MKINSFKSAINKEKLLLPYTLTKKIAFICVFDAFFHLHFLLFPCFIISKHMASFFFWLIMRTESLNLAMVVLTLFLF